MYASVIIQRMLGSLNLILNSFILMISISNRQDAIWEHDIHIIEESQLLHVISIIIHLMQLMN